MDYKIIIFPRAEKEISEAVFWYESQQKNLGRKLIKSINEALIRIGENPYLFSVSRFSFREVSLEKFPYLIIYRIVYNNILIQSLFNTYRDPIKKQ